MRYLLSCHAATWRESHANRKWAPRAEPPVAQVLPRKSCHIVKMFTKSARIICLCEVPRDYARKLMRDAYEKDTPIMRSLFYDCSKDERYWELRKNTSMKLNTCVIQNTSQRAKGQSLSSSERNMARRSQLPRQSSYRQSVYWAHYLSLSDAKHNLR